MEQCYSDNSEKVVVSNVVESFKKFNQGCRRPNRRRHLELCGYKLTRLIERDHTDDSPRKQAMQHLDALSKSQGGFYHGITLPLKDYHGWTYYEVWTKRI